MNAGVCAIDSRLNVSNMEWKRIVATLKEKEKARCGGAQPPCGWNGIDTW